jgi:hypothetical protein
MYIFKRGATEVEFDASSDIAAWLYVEANHSVSRTHAMRGETLYRIERVPVERPSPEVLRNREKLIAAYNKVTAK